MAAGGPTYESRSRHGWWWVAAGVLALLITGLVFLWIKAPDLYGTGDTAKTATATTRGGILTVAAAFIAALKARCAQDDREPVRRLAQLTDLRVLDVLTWAAG